jgi:SAM-dependent methyltransferase
MARGNAPFNVALTSRLHELYPQPARILEVGCGPGVGLRALLEVYPSAQVVGVDLSPQMLDQSRARNRQAIRDGRLELREGDVSEFTEQADLILAVHVLYFWHAPDSVLRNIRGLLASGGVLALGYRRREAMPPPARRDFPKEGHLLYDSERDVADLLTAAGFDRVESHLIVSKGSGLGWLTLGYAP